MGKRDKKSGKKDKILSQFFSACNYGQVDVIKQSLTDNPDLTTMQDDKCYSALHIAVLAGQLSSVMVLLNWGADPNVTTNDLKTPLYLAIRNGYLQITEKLIERGGEPWRKSNSSKTCLHAAVEIVGSDAGLGLKLIKLILYKKKYKPDLFNSFINTKNSQGLTAFELAKRYFSTTNDPITKQVIEILKNAKVPAEEYEINILLHGWNDKLDDWCQIEKNFSEAVNNPFYLFAYNSLANRVSIGTLAEDLHIFITEKLSLYKKEKQSTFTSFKQSSTNLTALKEIHISVNIICYSTGGLIVRNFLQHYYKKFRRIIDRVIFLAPANMGSPFAKFGKSSVGKIYTGQKKVGCLFECGEELLTSLEPNSPFIWDLAKNDIYEKEENQFFVPSEIMATIIQGTKHYPKNYKTKVTRGDMRGTDGTVTISGASLRAITYSMNLSGGPNTEIKVKKSTTDVALRLHPAHTHRSLVDSLLLKTDVFFLVRRALETTRAQFQNLQKSFEEENEIHYSSCHTPGNLLIFQYFGPIQPVLIPQILIHPNSYIPKLGQVIDKTEMKIESKASIIGKIREQFNYTEYHSRSKQMFYKIADLPLISKIMISIASSKKSAVSLALCLKGQTDMGRIFASTTWIDTYNDCFYNSDMGVTSMFKLAPVLATQSESHVKLESIPNLDTTDNSTFAINSLTKDDCLDNTLSFLETPGIIHLCRLFYRDKMFDKFLSLICKYKQEELSGKTKARIIRALVPFFSASYEIQEACANLIITMDSTEISSFKEEMDSEHANESQSLYDDLPTPIMCKSLHQLVFTLFEKVPFKFLKYGNNAKDLEKYITTDEEKHRGVPFINLGVLIAEKIFTISEDIDLDRAMKFLVFVEDVIQPKDDIDYKIGNISYPGINLLLSKLSEDDNMDIILLQSNEYQKDILLEGVSYISLQYPNSRSIHQFIVEYLSLYPEFCYSVIGNNSKEIYTEIVKLFEIYEGVWALFKYNKDFICDDFNNMNNLEYNFSSANTWIDGALIAHEQELLVPTDVINISQDCIEQLQFGLMRKYITKPADKWQEVIESLVNVKIMVSLLPTGLSKITCRLAVAALYRSARENFAALLLSDSGIDMLLEFKKYLDKNQKDNKADTLFANYDMSMGLVDISKQNNNNAFILSHILQENKNSIIKSTRREAPTLRRSTKQNTEINKIRNVTRAVKILSASQPIPKNVIKKPNPNRIPQVKKEDKNQVDNKSEKRRITVGATRMRNAN